MKRESRHIRALRYFFSSLDQGMYLGLAIIQILFVRGCAKKEMWSALSLIFIGLGLLCAWLAGVSRKPLHAVYDASGDIDRKRHRRQLQLSLVICLLTALSTYKQFYRPAIYAENLLSKSIADTGYELKVLECKESAIGGSDVQIIVDDLVGAHLSLPYQVDLAYGDRFRAPAVFRSLEPAGNPGGFDERSYRLSQGILLKAELAKGTDIPAVLKHKLRDRPQRLANRINASVSSYFVSVFGVESGALAAAMLLGNEQYLSRTTKEHFKLSGLSHLLVVSGSNVSLVFTFLLPLLQRSNLGWRWRQLALLPALIFFGALINWDASVSRAIAMNLVLVTARILYRPIKGSTALGLAVCLILALHPGSALQMGFLMSSAVSYALMTVLLPLTERILVISLKRLRLRKQWIVLNRNKQNHIRILIAAMITPAVSQLAVMPFSLAIGSVFTFWSIPLNWAAVPLSASLTILLTVVSPFTLLAPLLKLNIARQIFKPIQVLLLLLRKLASLPAEWSIRAIRPGKQFIYVYFLIILLLICFLLAISFRKAMRVSMVYAGAIGIILLGSYVIQPDLQIYFLSVGQGDAAIILMKNGQSVLVDTGTAEEGARVIPAALRELGIARIDLAIITHLHDDHAGALEFLMHENLIKAVAAPPPVLGSGLEADGERRKDIELSEKAEALGIRWSKVSAGDDIKLGKLFQMECLAPEEGQRQTGNASSLVFHLYGQQLDLLLTGDCEAAAEQSMERRAVIPDVDILKVAHHGSKTSSSDRFLTFCQPEVSLISVGRNYYGHPHDAVLQSLQDIGSQVFRTDRDGALVVTSRAEGWTIYRYKRANKLWKGS